jgi:hypothetical protein
VAEWEGEPVGTTAAFVFGDVAWIAAVLVEQSHRSRGIGKALMRTALDWLDQRGVRSIRLDATPFGQPLYEKLGFVAQYELARHEGVPAAAPAVEGVESAPPEMWETLIALDHQVTRTDRRPLLLRLFQERPEAVRIVRSQGRIQGFLTTRSGSRAVQIGPCLAGPEAGPLLLADAWNRHAGQRIYVDIPREQISGIRLAEGQGLTVQRNLLRMVRGEPVQEYMPWLWTSSGPEKG